LEEAMERRPLPMELDLIRLEKDGDDVVASTSAAPVQLHLKLSGFRLALTASYTNCSITPNPLTGYYQVPGGANFTYQCQSVEGTALAEVLCGEGVSFVVPCTDTPSEATISLSLHQSTIDVECRVECPAGSTTFQLKGALLFPSLHQFGDEVKVMSQGGDDAMALKMEGDWWPDLSQWWEQVKGMDWGGWLEAMIGRQLTPFLVLLSVLGLGLLWKMGRAHPIRRGFQILTRTLVVAVVVTLPLETNYVQAMNIGGPEVAIRHDGDVDKILPNFGAGPHYSKHHQTRLDRIRRDNQTNPTNQTPVKKSSTYFERQPDQTGQSDGSARGEHYDDAQPVAGAGARKLGSARGGLPHGIGGGPADAADRGRDPGALPPPARNDDGQLAGWGDCPPHGADCGRTAAQPLQQGDEKAEGHSAATEGAGGGGRRGSAATRQLGRGSGRGDVKG
jgi:hypothetical protein